MIGSNKVRQIELDSDKRHYLLSIYHSSISEYEVLNYSRCSLSAEREVFQAKEHA